MNRCDLIRRSLVFVCAMTFFAQVFAAGEAIEHVSSSNTHTLLTLGDGASFGAGLNPNGELGRTSANLIEVFLGEGGPSNLKMAEAGSGYTLWLTNAGQLLGSGAPVHGFPGHGVGPFSQPVVIMESIHAVDAAESNSYVIDQQGQLWGWGKNSDGQLAQGNVLAFTEKVLVDAGPVSQVSASDSLVAWLRSDGQLFGAGSNAVGTLGSQANLIQSTALKLDEGVQRLSMGLGHLIYLKSDGSVWGLGANDRGQLGDGSQQAALTPRRLVNSGIRDLDAGREHSLVLTERNNLFGAGANGRGQLGLGTTGDSLVLTQISGNVTSAWAENDRITFLKDDGKIYSAGDNPHGELGVGLSPLAISWTSVVAGNVSSVVSSTQASLILYTDGSVWLTGTAPYGSGTTRHQPEKILNSGAVSIAMGGSHALAIMDDGRVMGFGQNSFGQLGDGSVLLKNTWAELHPGPAQSVSAGEAHSLLLLQSGNLLVAGDNGLGQIGLGVTFDSNAWTSVDTDVQSISAGGFHSLYRKADGSLRVFGRGSEGQLGLGNTTSQRTPTLLPSLQGTPVGSYLSSFVMDDLGQLWSFGENGNGQLGLGHGNLVTAPVQTSLQNIQNVSASRTHTMAWGSGNAWVSGTGWLQPNALQLSQVALQWSALSSPSSSTRYSAGGKLGSNYSWALTNSGELYGMGHHGEGHLGYGQHAYRSLPVFVGGGQAFVSSTDNIIVNEEEILEIDADELQEGDEILDQNTGPQLRRVPGGAGGCLLKGIDLGPSTFIKSKPYHSTAFPLQKL